MRSTRPLLVAGVAALALVAAPASAQATIFDHVRYADSFTDTFDACGTTFSTDYANSGHIVMRLADDGDLVLFQDVGKFSNTITNLATGRAVYLHGNTNYREVSAQRVGDIITLEVRQSGVPVVFEDAAGKVISRDRGMLHYVQALHVVGDEFEFLDEEVLDDHGAHPAFYADSCDIVMPVIG